MPPVNRVKKWLKPDPSPPPPAGDEDVTPEQYHEWYARMQLQTREHIADGMEPGEALALHLAAVAATAKTMAPSDRAAYLRRAVPAAFAWCDVPLVEDFRP